MEKNELVSFMAQCLNEKNIDKLMKNCARSVKYYSENNMVANGKNAVRNELRSVQNANNRDGIANYYFSATVEKSSVPEIVTGDCIVPFAQFDKYNCTGFFTIKTNVFGKIKLLHFHTDAGVKFKCDANEKCSISKVPSDAHDAIGFRAIAFGIMDGHVVLSKHIQRYDVFNEMLDALYEYIMRYVVNDFNKCITNIAGYMYTMAMIEAVNRNRPGAINISFSPKKAASGVIPKVGVKYQKWIDEGYKTGTKLFLGFIEYVELRHPNDRLFTEQMMQSFMDMCLYGSTQANKEMDMGIV